MKGIKNFNEIIDLFEYFNENGFKLKIVNIHLFSEFLSDFIEESGEKDNFNNLFLVKKEYQLKDILHYLTQYSIKEEIAEDFIVVNPFNLIRGIANQGRVFGLSFDFNQPLERHMESIVNINYCSYGNENFNIINFLVNIETNFKFSENYDLYKKEISKINDINKIESFYLNLINGGVDHFARHVVNDHLVKLKEIPFQKIEKENIKIDQNEINKLDSFL